MGFTNDFFPLFYRHQHPTIILISSPKLNASIPGNFKDKAREALRLIAQAVEVNVHPKQDFELLFND